MAASTLKRAASFCRTIWLDEQERRGGAESRLLRVFHGLGHGDARAVALYAHFSPHSGISDMVVGQLRDYARLGFRIVFISASPRFEDVDFARISDTVELAIHRRNFGLDFGGWADALALVPEAVAGADELLLVNDSVLGPLHPLDEPIARMRASGEGLFGLTDSLQQAPHLQSYFLLARGRPVIASVVAFLRSSRLSNSKQLVVKRFEVALSEHMRDQGHRVAALWGYDDLESELLRSDQDLAALFAALPGETWPEPGPGSRLSLRRQLLDLPLNPIHHFASILVRRCGFPFLKTELVLRNPQRIPEAVDWRALIPQQPTVSLQAIEQHLAAYERPLRLADTRLRNPSHAPQPDPGEAGPAEAEIATPAWRHTLAAARSRPRTIPAPVAKRVTIAKRDILGRISRSPLVISFSHDDYAVSCGGVQNVLHAEQLRFAAEGLGYLHLSPSAPGNRLVEDNPAALFSVRLDGVHLGTAAFDALLEVCRELGPQNAILACLVHHLAGHAPEQILALHKAAKARQLLFWLHDFGTLCESSALLRNDIAFCGAPPLDSSACLICSHGAGRSRHLKRMRAFFEAASPSVLAPSDVALDFWRSRFGSENPVSAVVPPALLTAPNSVLGRPPGGRLRVAHLGARVFHKGWHVFAELAERFSGTGRYEFLQFGIDEGLPLGAHVRHVPVQVGPDDRTAMVDAVAAEDVDVVVNWSLCFETFSFTTYEALAGGAFVVTHPRSGNVWAAIRQNAPRQGYAAGDEADLKDLFATERLGHLMTAGRPARHSLVLGGGSAEWLLMHRAETRKRSLARNG